MKADKTNIDKARKLLAAWYDSESQTGSEAWLRDFFATAEALPSDLESERAMFLALQEAMTQPVKMPEDVKARLDEALEEEMRRERHSIWRRRRTWISGAACMLLLIGGALTVRNLIDNGNRQPDTLASVLKSKVTDTLPDLTPMLTSEAATDTATAVHMAKRVEQPKKIAESEKTVKPKKHRVRPTSEAGQNGEALYANALTDEERRMEAMGYRVVRSEREAKAVVGFVMAKVEENVVESSYRVSEVVDRIDCVISDPTENRQAKNYEI